MRRKIKIMIRIKIKTAVAVAGAGALVVMTASLRAEDFVKYQSKFGSKVSIAGTSTIHDWTMDGKMIKGFIELPAGVTVDTAQADLTGAKPGKIDARAEVAIPVAAMKSEHEGMDEVMQQAMDEKDHPLIQFHLTEMTLKGPHAAGSPFQFDTKGELAMNGVTNTISLPVTFENTDKARLKITGSIPLKMTDYQVKPPTLKVVGVGISTGDEVKISFEWIVAPAPAPAK
jgi:polyisoprenoid-binding protein YceI